ncbi:Meiotic recombination protein dmc1 [Mitosporidium daphniae]
MESQLESEAYSFSTEHEETQNIALEEDGTYLAVEELQHHGVSMMDIQKLKMSGICSVKGVQMTTRKNLCKLKGMSEAKVEEIKEVAAKLLDCGFITATELAIKRQCVFKVSTGSSELDRLVGGGIQSMSITEAFGEFRTGKTQLCLTMCITCQLGEQNTSGKAAYIDTEGTFRPERLKEIAARFNLNPDEALENIIYSRAYNSEHQMDLLAILAAKFSEEPGRFKLLVVDSIISLFRTDFSGRGELGERQQRLNQMLARLARISEEYNVAVFITNQMMSDPGAAISFVPDPKKPIGGHVLAHASTTRLSLRKGRNETRIAKVYDSPDMPEAEATYAIGPGGIEDAAV